MQWRCPQRMRPTPSLPWSQGTPPSRPWPRPGGKLWPRIISHSARYPRVFSVLYNTWKHLISQTIVDDICEDDIEDEEDEIDGDIVDYESTDSMTSANQLNGFILATKTEKDPKSPFQLKRPSATSNAIFYNARPCLSHQNSQQVCHLESHAVAKSPSLSVSHSRYANHSTTEPSLNGCLQIHLWGPELPDRAAELYPGAGHPSSRLVPDHVSPRHQTRGVTEESWVWDAPAQKFWHNHWTVGRLAESALFTVLQKDQGVSWAEPTTNSKSKL